MFEEISFSKLVITSTKEENVEVVNASDFFELLSKLNIIKSNKAHDNLQKFFALKQSIPDILYLKKILKALKDIKTNESLKQRCNSLVQAKKNEKKGNNAP